MYFLRKSFSLFIILLFFLSIYKDITIGTFPFNEKNINQVKFSQSAEINHHPKVIEIYLQPGDTVLSVTEQLSNKQNELNIQQVINDFIVINPGVNPYHLQPNHPYLFHSY